MSARQNPGGVNRIWSIAAMVAVLAAVLGVATTVGAQNGPGSNCGGSSVTEFGSAFFGTEDNGNRLLSSGPTEREYPLSSPLPAGTYAINAVSYDGYSTRDVIPPQPIEQWYAQFLASDGSVLATTGTTEDIADSVVEAFWTGSLGEVTLTAEATSVLIVHAAPGSPNVNSVRPVCIGTDLVDDEPIIAGSSVAVDYENLDQVSRPVELDCGGNRVDSATGRIVELIVDDLAPASVCAVTYTDGADLCTLDVTANAADTGFDGNVFEVTVPDSGGANIFVDIRCGTDNDNGADDGNGDGGDGGDGSNTDVTVTPPTITPEVKGTTEVATPVDLTPSFTG